MKRHKIPMKKSKKSFSHHASHSHPKNSMGSSGGSMAMRGGIRL
jgi:hypothetical protein